MPCTQVMSKGVSGQASWEPFEMYKGWEDEVGCKPVFTMTAIKYPHLFHRACMLQPGLSHLQTPTTQLFTFHCVTDWLRNKRVRGQLPYTSLTGQVDALRPTNQNTRMVKLTVLNKINWWVMCQSWVWRSVERYQLSDW